MQFPGNFYQWKKVTLFILAAAILILGTVTVVRAAFLEKSRTDLTVYLRAADAVIHHENIYTVENERHWHYVYLPLLAILLTPFASLPLWANSALWYLISVLALAGTAYGLSKLFRKNQIQKFFVPCACIILALPPLLNTFTRGQMGTISLFLTLLPFMLDYKGKKFLAGFFLGFAIILKMSPLLVLPFYFLVRKNWKALLGCGFSVFFLALVFPSLFFSVKVNIQYLVTYFKAISEGSGDMAWKSYLWGELFTPFSGDNQSFYAVLTRWFWKSEEAFIGHSNAVIRYLNLGLLMVLLSLITWMMLRAKKFDTFRFSDFKSRAFAPTAQFTQFSLLSMVMLFTSPVTQPHHYTPIMLLGAAAFLNTETNPRFRKILYAAMIICLVFFSLGILMEPFALIGLPFLGSLLLWVAVFIAANKNTSPASSF